MCCFNLGVQGVLLSWSKNYKARGVQGTDVVESLRQAISRTGVINGSFTPDTQPEIYHCHNEMLSFRCEIWKNCNNKNESNKMKMKMKMMMMMMIK